MGIGKFRHFITLQGQGTTRDSGGGISSGFSTIASVYANVVPKSGKEVYKRGKLVGSVTHEITIRYRTDITNASRISFNNKLFNIRSIINIDERGRYLKLMCEEGVAT
jgi:SPP1 family predicted phage head-tail adaptor|tara:strand:- start:449 stop:772 length:324 start_codon:yes stop_codon:yes gene_type:complete